jgi:NTE family protein
MITNLALKGGGVRGIAYLGALEVLETKNILPGIKRFAGTSAGALLALKLALGYTVPEISEIMHKLDFKDFTKGKHLLPFLRKYGLHSGDYILEFVKTIIKQNKHHTLNENATFQDMKDAGCKDLYVYACNMNKNDKVEFSFEKTPDTIVAEAVRASMSIPIYFDAFKFSNNRPDADIYVDGGIVFNYPLSLFDETRFGTNTGVNIESIGLYLYSKNPIPLKELDFGHPIGNPLNFAKRLFGTLLHAQDVINREETDIIDRSVMIDDDNFSATNFDLSDNDKKQLVDSGRAAMLEFINNNNFVQWT